MVSYEVPYGKKSMTITIPEENVKAVLTSSARQVKSEGDERDLVEGALDHPIESEPLEVLAKDKETIVIITSDHTRPVPSHITLPILLRRIRSVNSTAKITILVATGFHRATTEAEMREKFGDDIVDHEHIVVHDATADEDMVSIGTLPSGGDCRLNRVALEADLLIAEGFIEPHFFAGFSGGRKSVLPGIASRVTVLANHCAEFIASPYARTGILEGNPIHEDMIYAAKVAKLAFILNVTIDEDKRIMKAFAGHPIKAHYAGAEFMKDIAGVEKVEADIVITTNGGYPMDRDFYQSVKGMTAAEATCKPGGVIIMIAACNDGHGGQPLYDALSQSKDAQALFASILTVPRNETKPMQWKIQITARILKEYTVIMVTDQCDLQIFEDMHIEAYKTFAEALHRAFELKGQEATVTLIPDGVSVIVK